MSSRLIIDGNSVYEIDEECEERRSSGQIHRQSVRESDGEKEVRKKNGDGGPDRQPGQPQMPDS